MYKTLILIDNDEQRMDVHLGEWLSFETYLREYPKLNEPKIRIINLCDTEHYLSKGYYCSLLAEARIHHALPSVKTINELRILFENDDDSELFRKQLNSIELPQDTQTALIYFGLSKDKYLQKLANQIFKLYPAPILKITLNRSVSNANSITLKIERYAFLALSDAQRNIFTDHLSEFAQTNWKNNFRQKKYRWDMAILVNPNETSPPSNKVALSRFVKAAEKNSIHAHLLSIDELSNINSYDALFIRETTAIDHHTYRLASKAESVGLVVLDDPTSILRCCNKVYLHDAFSYQNVPSLRTEVISDDSVQSIDLLEEIFEYPFVLKMPESSFSKGVFKVNNRQELKNKLEHMFKESALILAQEYLFTEFDWRIGILNGRAIYACRYMMAKNHWQIYNHNAKNSISGNSETLPTFEAPRVVLDAALKATKFIGDGFYGVDIKQHKNHAHVIEVNDNPSIDHKVEDAYLGNELYMQIMAEFQRRLELKGR